MKLQTLNPAVQIIYFKSLPVVPHLSHPLDILQYPVYQNQWHMMRGICKAYYEPI